MKSLLFFQFSLMFLGGLFAQAGTINIYQDEDIAKLLEYKKDVTTNAFYKIQVFQSLDPDFAESQRRRFLNTYNDWPVEIHWQTPNYKVWVGNFSSRLEADRALQKIRKTHPNANVLKPKSR